jgi:hypothetical protein
MIMDEVDPVHIVVEKAAAEAGIAPVIMVGNLGTDSGDAKFVSTQSDDGDTGMQILEDAKADSSEIQDEGVLSYITAVGDQENVTLQVAGDDNLGVNQTYQYILTTDETGNVIQQVQQADGQIIMQESETLSGEPQVIHVQATDEQTEFDLSTAQIVTMSGGTDGTTQYITLPTSHSGQVFTLPVNLPDGTTQTQIITLPQEYSQLSSGGQLVFSTPDAPGNQISQVITAIPSIEQPVSLQSVPSAEPVTNNTQTLFEFPEGEKNYNSNITMKHVLGKPQPKIRVVQPQKKKAPPKPPKPPPVPPPPPKPDLENPIQLSEETVVVVGGKKCFLRCNPDTGEFTAYPVKQEIPPGEINSV